ncbi:MAG: DNA adenine methylase [Deltaproteobacteria bacterium]|jgi:DNA adenine methylase|nr:DNA adenine methylase [Deltaproteobacteria bacterium]
MPRPRKSASPDPKPFVKWAGGKRQLLPDIRANLPEDSESLRYFEPFLGGGAVLFRLRPARAVVSDLNRDLMGAYMALKDAPGQVIRRLKELAGDLSARRYYEVRDMDRAEGYPQLTAAERAARLIYLNRTCYNGLYRVNSRGHFNVPRGSYADPAVCNEEALRSAAAYLREADVNILCGDFADAVREAGEGSLVYFDPPYHAPDRNFTSYQSGGFGESEQERLRDVYAELTSRGAKCLLSNADTPFIRYLYGNTGFRIVPVQAARAINSRAGGRGKVGEVLVRNYGP